MSTVNVEDFPSLYFLRLMRHISNIWALHLILQRWFIYVDFSINQWFVGEKQDTEDVISHLVPHLTGKLFKDSKLYPPKFNIEPEKMMVSFGISFSRWLLWNGSMLNFRGCISKNHLGFQAEEGEKQMALLQATLASYGSNCWPILKWHRKPTSTLGIWWRGMVIKHHIKLLKGFCVTQQIAPSKTKMSFGKKSVIGRRFISFWNGPLFFGDMFGLPPTQQQSQMKVYKNSLLKMS